MKFFRFSLLDSNFRLGENNALIWDLPLFLSHRQVALSSYSLELATVPEVQPTFLRLKLNLLECSMQNQHGVLKVIPLMIDNDYSYGTQMGDKEFWEIPSQSRFNTVEMTTNIDPKHFQEMSFVLAFSDES